MNFKRTEFHFLLRTVWRQHLWQLICMHYHTISSSGNCVAVWDAPEVIEYRKLSEVTPLKMIENVLQDDVIRHTHFQFHITSFQRPELSRKFCVWKMTLSRHDFRVGMLYHYIKSLHSYSIIKRSPSRIGSNILARMRHQEPRSPPRQRPRSWWGSLTTKQAVWWWALVQHISHWPWSVTKKPQAMLVYKHRSSFLCNTFWPMAVVPFDYCSQGVHQHLPQILLNTFQSGFVQLANLPFSVSGFPWKHHNKYSLRQE